MHIKTPIIVVEGWDIILYRTVSEAEAALEPIDVRQGIHKAFDAAGRLLKLELIKKKKPLFMGFFKATVEHVVISLAEVEPKHKTELRDTLFTYLNKIGIAMDVIGNLPLENLIEKASEGLR